MLAASTNLWERRMAIVATHAFIAKHQFADTFAICEKLLADNEDLIHKACGWMLREVYKKSPTALEQFLRAHATRMPRTMLRNAIEKMPVTKRKAWLKGTVEKRTVEMPRTHGALAQRVARR
jgi:3-methyladenine DNA glycosylase AlkD